MRYHQMKLNNIQCESAKPKEKPYKMADGQGMYLDIQPNGSKYWRFRYRMHGKQKLAAFGVYPDVSLKDAREKRRLARQLLDQGIDPNDHKRKEKRKASINANNTFESVAIEWHEKKKGGWTKNYADNVIHRLKNDVFPYIGSDPIADIDAPHLLDMLRRIEKRGALDLAGRIRQICGQVFRYGIQTGKCKRDPSIDLKGALETRKVKHFDAIDAKEIPELLDALERNDARL